MTSSKGGVGGVSQMMIFDDIGGVGVPEVPKMDDVIYEQSLRVCYCSTRPKNDWCGIIFTFWSGTSEKLCDGLL